MLRSFPRVFRARSELPPSLSVCVAAAEGLDRCGGEPTSSSYSCIHTSNRELLRDVTGKELGHAPEEASEKQPHPFCPPAEQAQTTERVGHPGNRGGSKVGHFRE